MEPVVGELEGEAGGVKYSAPQVTLVSNVTGGVAGEEVCRAGYWRRHAREAVRFGDGIVALGELGYRVFLEVGPSPTLLGMGRKCLSADNVSWLPSLRRPGDDWAQMLDSLGRLYVAGAAVDRAAARGGGDTRPAGDPGGGGGPGPLPQVGAAGARPRGGKAPGPRHATGRLPAGLLPSPSPLTGGAPPLDVKTRCAETVPGHVHY